VNPFSYDSGLRIPLFGHVIPVLFDSFVAILLVRFLFGCGEAGAYPNLTRVNGLWFPFRERAFAQGAVWMSARLGGAIAPFVIGRLSAGIGWQNAFGVLGLLGLVWAVLFWSWFRDRPEDMPACNEAERQLIRTGVRPGDHGSHAGVPWGRMLSSFSMWAMCTVAACVSFGWYFYPTWQPKFFEEVYRTPPENSEILTGLPFLCGAAGCLFGGKLSDYLVRRIGRRWGRSLLGCVGFTLAGLCVLGTGYARTRDQAVFLLCLAFFINDLAIPVIWAVSSDIGGRHSGVVAGFMNMCGGIGAVVSPALTPHLLALGAGRPAAERWQIVFAVLASAWFLGALAWLAINARKPLFDEPHTTAERSDG
jgi:MFS family permease